MPEVRIFKIQSLILGRIFPVHACIVYKTYIKNPVNGVSDVPDFKIQTPSNKTLNPPQAILDNMQVLLESFFHITAKQWQMFGDPILSGFSYVVGPTPCWFCKVLAFILLRTKPWLRMIWNGTGNTFLPEEAGYLKWIYEQILVPEGVTVSGLFQEVERAWHAKNNHSCASVLPIFMIVRICTVIGFNL